MPDNGCHRRCRNYKLETSSNCEAINALDEEGAREGGGGVEELDSIYEDFSLSNTTRVRLSIHRVKDEANLLFVGHHGLG